MRSVEVRERRLRWPVPEALPDLLRGQLIRGVERRAKYLLFNTDAGTLLVHLGMSGSLRVLPARPRGGRSRAPGAGCSSGRGAPGTAANPCGRASAAVRLEPARVRETERSTDACGPA